MARIHSKVQGSRIQITHAARSFSTTTARRDADDASREKTMATLMADVEAGNLPLDETLEKMGLDPVEYKAYAGPYICY
jgi:hypothetical protein